FWDIDAMADAIYALLRYKSLPAMFAKYGAKEVDNLKWENAARHIKKVYADVL
ncbi:MAG TPA: 4-alpha-glucanotransferase, partial [Bacteroidales bacterium]|nr:4-alpha-glucanotransferase [Bacteroidales bacterium]